MKKTLLTLGAIAAVSAPIITVVSCGQKSNAMYAPLETPPKQSHEIKVNYSLDGMDYDRIKTYISNVSTLHIQELTNIEQKYLQKLQEDVISMRFTSSESDTGKVIHTMKQDLANYIYEMGSVNYSESISYKGSTTTTFSRSVDLTSIISLDDIAKSDSNNISDLTTKMSNAVNENLGSSADGVKNFVKSAEYKSWYKDQITDAQVDVADVYLIEIENPLIPGQYIARLAINPTDQEIDDYFAKLDGFLKSNFGSY